MLVLELEYYYSYLFVQQILRTLFEQHDSLQLYLVDDQDLIQDIWQQDDEARKHGVFFYRKKTEQENKLHEKMNWMVMEHNQVLGFFYVIIQDLNFHHKMENEVQPSEKRLN
jgi:hypothetical protein